MEFDRTKAGSANPPSISVIIPVYNQAQYVKEAIQSVLAQTWPDFELIVVDDGSTDETPQVLARFNDSRIRVIRQPNGGLSAARNRGLRESIAPYISLLDSDDFYYPEKLELLKNYLDTHPEIGMVSGGFVIVDPKGITLKQVLTAAPMFGLPDMLVYNPFIPSAVMIRKEWLDVVGDFDEAIPSTQDWDLWLRMSYAGSKFAWIDCPVAAYRYHPAQMTREKNGMRNSSLATLDKFFSQPHLPESLITFKDHAYAIAYLSGAAWAYHSNATEEVKENILQAVQLDPSLKDDRYKQLVECLVGWADDPRSIKPAVFLQRVMENTPSGLPALRNELRKALADVLLAPFFKEPRVYRRTNRRDLIKVILFKPGWLFNRGFLRIFIDAWLGV